MKTNLVIDDGVMRRLKEEAARTTGKTLSELVDSALRAMLDHLIDGPPAALPPLPTFSGGSLAVDISDRDAFYQALEGR